MATIVGKTILTFNKDVALDFLVSKSFAEIATKLPILLGGWGFILAPIFKLVLGAFFKFTVEGAHRVQVEITSMVKEHKYKKMRTKIDVEKKKAEDRGEELSERQKKKLYKEYVRAASRALSL